MVALGFMVLLAVVNLRGVGESVKFNVVLTLIEIAALLDRDRRRLLGDGPQGGVDLGRVVVFELAGDRGMFAAVTVATAIAFFAMVGFEDSVNMVEETKDPERDLPARSCSPASGIAVVIYVLVAVSVVMVLPLGRDPATSPPRAGILLEVVQDRGAGLPDRHGLPVPHRLRGRQHRADQHADGQPAASTAWPSRTCCRASLGEVLPGRRTPWVGDRLHHRARLGPDRRGDACQADSSIVGSLAGTTGLLLLCVFAVVNVACLVLRRNPVAPVVQGADGGARRRRGACLFLAGPWARDPERLGAVRIAACAARPRRGAVGAHLADQPRHRYRPGDVEVGEQPRALRTALVRPRTRTGDGAGPRVPLLVEPPREPASAPLAGARGAGALAFLLVVVGSSWRARRGRRRLPPRRRSRGRRRA